MLGYGELIIIFAVILLLFGGKKLPELAKSLGKGINEFKKACNGEAKETASCPCSEKKDCCKQEETDD